MSFIKALIQDITGNGTVTLANKSTNKSYVQSIVPKSIAQSRQDIKNWTSAQVMAQKAEEPKRFPLQNLYDNIMLDLHLQSQLNNRMQKSLSQSFSFTDLNGKLNDVETAKWQNSILVHQINKAILETIFYGHNLGEFAYNGENLEFNTIPRQNVDPVNGLLYYDYADDKKINYRNQPEYGTWLMEFGNAKNLGLLNGCVPHVLFKRYAQSCWSELCEIYGIPPRVLKTNTQDRTLVSRAEKMLQDMGSAAWFIIDSNESFEWAKGVDTNGDVYANLISLCNNEISMAVSGAVIGQDTKNGSNSKEQVSLSVLQDLIDADMTLIEMYWNTIVIPALQQLGVLPKNIVFKYDPADDTTELWKRTVEALPYMDVDVDWVKQKFGIEVKAKAETTPNKQQLNFNIDPDFFA